MALKRYSDDVNAETGEAFSGVGCARQPRVPGRDSYMGEEVA